jgi:hypothetical protein
MPNIVYKYTGKPSKSQEIKEAYTSITDGRFVPPGDGWLFTMCYVNNGHGENKTGGMRVQCVRENPVDETCYNDYAIIPGMVSATSFLMQPIWFGAATKGRAMHWKLRRSKKLGKVTAGTRYTKWLWISADLATGFTSGPSRSKPSLSDLFKLFELISNLDEGDESFEVSI